MSGGSPEPEYEGGPLEHPDHAVDVPQAVAEHDPVVGVAIPLDVPGGLPQQSGGVDESATGSAMALLRVLAPLPGELLAAADDEPGSLDGLLHVIGPHT